MPYGLAGHVFVCRDEDSIVVLDVKQDRYFALDAASTAALTPVLPGWPAHDATDHPSLEVAAAPLLAQGWLLDATIAAKDAWPVRVPPPQAEALLDTGAVKIDFRVLSRFVAASVFAKLALRLGRFERVIQRVTARKARRGHVRPVELARLRELAESFARLRVFLFPSRDQCLHDSLAMLEFLARYHVFPSWIFGVRARPFAAHCWLQHDDVVLNDSVEHVSTYTPIMAV